MLRQLARRGDVKRVHYDRPVEALLGRTSATIGAITVQRPHGLHGEGIGVAVIDSGVTPNHDDLRYAGGRRSASPSSSTSSTSTRAYDDWGHGTHVAGIIAGNGYDRYGARAGIAPAATMVALKALDGKGRGRISTIIAALDWAVANRRAYNIRVINMSLGAGVFESYNTDPLTLAAKRAVTAGIVVVAAAGNIGKNADGNPQYGAITAPANAPWVLTVGAADSQGHHPPQRRHDGALQLARADDARLRGQARPGRARHRRGVAGEPRQQDVRREAAVPRWPAPGPRVQAVSHAERHQHGGAGGQRAPWR